MNKSKTSPVLNYEMIKSNIKLFETLNGFKKDYNIVKKSISSKCYECSVSERKAFAQKVRNHIIEFNRKDIFNKLDPRTIVRYKNKIYRVSDFI
ncbi:MAG: hypothetical protein ACOCUI_02010 [bacterium]